MVIPFARAAASRRSIVCFGSNALAIVLMPSMETSASPLGSDETTRISPAHEIVAEKIITLTNAEAVVRALSIFRHFSKQRARGHNLRFGRRRATPWSSTLRAGDLRRGRRTGHRRLGG